MARMHRNSATLRGPFNVLMALIGATCLVAVVAAAAILTDSSRASHETAIPWSPQRPPVAPPPPLAPPCRAVQMRAALALQGGIGNLVGGARLRNVGSRPCSLRGRPSVRFDGDVAESTRWRVVAARADPRDTSLIYDRGSSLRALAPGRAATLPLLWSNWCPPGTVVTTTGPPPERLVITLADGGELHARLRQAPRCDEPEGASTLAIKPFVAIGRLPPPRSRLPLKAAILGNSRPVKPGLPTLRVRRGSVLRYRVVLTNVSPRPFRFTRCPTYHQHVAPRGPTERYVLNCRPAGPLAPGRHVTFAMRLRVAPTIAAVQGLFWLLAPTTDSPPTASARLVIVD